MDVKKVRWEGAEWRVRTDKVSCLFVVAKAEHVSMWSCVCVCVCKVKAVLGWVVVEWMRRRHGYIYGPRDGKRERKRSMPARFMLVCADTFFVEEQLKEGLRRRAIRPHAFCPVQLWLFAHGGKSHCHREPQHRRVDLT